MKKHFEIKKLIRNYGLKKIFEAGAKEIYRKIWLEFFRNSYSQNGEDIIIEKLFNKNYIGKYLEIGAYHPKRLSNTFRFYKNGWTGIVIEPNPEIKDLFKIIRPKDKFLNLGISDKNQSLNYYKFFIPAINTFSKIEAEKNIKLGHKLKEIVKIKTSKIEKIIDSKIDFLSIDTEGFDEKILRSWPWERYKAKVICCENDDLRLEEYIKSKGYSLYKKTRANSIFLKN